MNFHPVARVLGNAGIYYVTALGGTTIANSPDFVASLWGMVLGLIITSSRELVKYGEEKWQRK